MVKQSHLGTKPRPLEITVQHHIHLSKFDKRKCRSGYHSFETGWTRCITFTLHLFMFAFRMSVFLFGFVS